MDGRFYPGWHLFGGLFGIALFALFIGALVWALLRLTSSHDHHAVGPTAPPPGPWAPRDDALNVARLRYARGELDREQYFRVVEDLTGVPRPPDSPPPVPPYPAPPVSPDPSSGGAEAGPTAPEA